MPLSVFLFAVDLRTFGLVGVAACGFPRLVVSGHPSQVCALRMVQIQSPHRLPVGDVECVCVDQVLLEFDFVIQFIYRNQVPPCVVSSGSFGYVPFGRSWCGSCRWGVVFFWWFLVWSRLTGCTLFMGVSVDVVVYGSLSFLRWVLLWGCVGCGRFCIYFFFH